MTAAKGGVGHVRALRPGDDQEVRGLFRDTVLLGRPAPAWLPDLAGYERLCLDWYLGAGRADAAVLEVDAAVAGYVLVCDDHEALRRWTAPRALAWAARAGCEVASGRGGPPARAFWRHRLHDTFTAARTGTAPPQPVQMHFNVARGQRARDAGVRLADHVDALCRARGRTGWYGEINAPAGRRVAALEFLGGELVARMPNRTFSQLAGRPIERLTMQRRVTQETPPLLTGRTYASAESEPTGVR